MLAVLAVSAALSVSADLPRSSGEDRAASHQVAQPTAAVTPRGYLQMFVAAVMPTGDSHTVVLVNPAEELLLPVGVALPEALTIFGRLEQKTAARPLTHDLLDHVVTALGAEVVAVHIDDLRAGEAKSTVFLRRRGAIDIVGLDARPTDAMAVALSAQAPIFVARPVVEREALTHDDLADAPSSAPQPEPGPTRTYEL
jgi:hypothetical protein